MSRRRFGNQARDWDIESGNYSKKDAVLVNCRRIFMRSDSGRWGLPILNPEGRLLRGWNMIFLVSCMIAVSVDPLFLYLPVINEDKCLFIDRRLKSAAICLRLLMDMVYLANIILQFRCAHTDEAASKQLGQTVFVTDAWPIAKKYLSSYFVFDILAILPLPQVLVPLIFLETRGSKSYNTRKLMNALVVLQYVPRVLQIYQSRKKVITPAWKLARVIWVEAAFNFFIYILASHVLGAFWYFFSIQQRATCWYKACKLHIGCLPQSFSCDRSSRNYGLLDDYCPVKTPNATLFDFGIFLDVLQSDVVSSTVKLKKIVHCFWWGLRNLSSFGQNLQTSTDLWENCFAVFISIFGLLAFLYFIGKVQIYMQLETNTWLETEKLKEILRAKERELKIWADRNQLPPDIREQVISDGRRLLEEKREFDEKSPYAHLSIGIRKQINRHLGFPILKKVPAFEKMDEQLLDAACDRLMLVLYTEGSYIVREGDPVNEMFFVIRGNALIIRNNLFPERKGYFTIAHCTAGDSFCWEVLIPWALDPHHASFSLPSSPMTAQARTHVEVFTLKADDLKFLASQAASPRRKLIYDNINYRFYSGQWWTWAASIIQRAWRNYKEAPSSSEARCDGDT